MFFDSLLSFPTPDLLGQGRRDYARLICKKAYDPPGKTKAAKAGSLRAMAAEMADESGDSADLSADGNIPAAYTYLGQFIDHDVTLSAALTPEPKKRSLRNGRSIRLDLDNLYGDGPVNQPYLYGGMQKGCPSPYLLCTGHALSRPGGNNLGERDLARINGRFLRVARMDSAAGPLYSALVQGDDSPNSAAVCVQIPAARVVTLGGGEFTPIVGTNEICAEQGLVRVYDQDVLTFGGQAVIGDSRNDENVIVGQLHLAFIGFHRAVFEKMQESPSCASDLDAFVKARRLVQWHYQWLVLHDYLKRIVGAEQWMQLYASLSEKTKVKPMYNWSAGSYMPLEFALAGFRFGHAMVRSSYQLNDDLPAVPIFVGSANPSMRADLRGRRTLPDGWTVQWELFLDGPKAQCARQITESLSGPMASLKVPMETGTEILPFVTLYRGWQAGLVSGQDAAAEFGIDPLPGGPDPLWYYVLREARCLGDNGNHLGPLGARIVAETLIGIVREDEESYLWADPEWVPQCGAVEGDFTLRDVLEKASAPITYQELTQYLSTP